VSIRWPGFRCPPRAVLVIFLGFGLAALATALDSLLLLAFAAAVMSVGLAFNFYLHFSKDRPDGT
jgi:hypothetical protein